MNATLVEHDIIHLDGNKSTLAPVMVSGKGSLNHAMYISSRLREDGIKVEMFLDQDMSITEQINFAKRRGFKLLIWTEEAADRGLQADDTVMMQDLRIPVRPSSYVCWGLFNGVRAALGMGYKICNYSGTLN